MKKNLFFVLMAFSGFSFGQLNILADPIITNGPRANPKAYMGIGTYNLSPVPNQNLQIHGINNYSRTFGVGKIIIGPGGDGTSGGAQPFTVNYGVTSAINLTNSYTGTTVDDGALIRMSEKNFTIDNLETDGNIVLASNGANLVLQGSTRRIYTGGTFFDINGQYANFNIWSDHQNALNIRAIGGGSGLTVSTADNVDAIMVFAGVNRNFAVTGSGQVYARKYTTTLNAIPDYVFENSYKLMPLNELKLYIKNNKHLPNIPSAKEVEANEGVVDLGEMNRLLLEKLEETTLYILQLEERLKALEDKK